MKTWKCMMFAISAAVLFGASLIGQPAPQPPVKQPGNLAHATGRVAPKNLKALRENSDVIYGKLLRSLPKATALKYDCRDLGIVPPIVDQGQCGSCWDFSGCGICTSAAIKAGVGKNDGSFRLCEQYVLDCGQNGGCSGDDNTTVLQMCKSQGLPNATDYGPYAAREGSCKSVDKSRFVKLSDWGFCTPGNQNGVASTQDIKNAMVAYGPIGCAVDAGFQDPGDGVISGGGNNIDHDVILVGWDDSKGRGGAWLMRNSWGTGWGNGGYAWIEYGSYSIGTEAVWCSVTSVLPPTPPTPPVPPPTPPPGPGPAPSTVTITLTVDQEQSIIAQSGQVTIRGDMTLREVMDALEKCRRQEPYPMRMPP